LATGGVFTPGSRPRDLQFDEALLGRVVAAARREGRSVAAHCHGTAGIAAALRSGVRTIEHASFAGADGFGTDLDEALMRELAAREVWVSPTVNAGSRARPTRRARLRTSFADSRPASSDSGPRACASSRRPMRGSPASSTTTSSPG
jgi:imidazolonepropionase-like amidohydrolase